jgi:2-C-methyl-D-erythritol 4-phosphate cytidylyltransferase
MKKIAIIVAGGSGTRMGCKTPKQFIEINNKPVIIYSFEAFYHYDKSVQFILALHNDYFSLWEKIIKKYPVFKDIEIVTGGKTRFHSVQNAVRIIREEALIAVHDAVRPIVSVDTIARCYETAGIKGCAVPCMEVSESLRELIPAGSRPVDRNKIVTIQTPQVFRSDILIKAYRQRYSAKYTDDSTVVENAGYKITLTGGNRHNIKITTKEDLIFAEILLTNKALQG